MKKVVKLMVMLVFAATLTTMVSCSKSNESSIIGKWKCLEDSTDLFGIGGIADFQSDGYVYVAFASGRSRTYSYQIKDERLILIDLLTYDLKIDEMSSTTMKLSMVASGKVWRASLEKL